MEVRLTPEQEEIVRRATENGRSPEAVVSEALALWEDNERKLAELRALIAEADAHADEDAEYTDETLPDLIEEIKREGRALRDARMR